MKGREAIEIIKEEIHSYSPNTSSEFAERVAEGIYKRMCSSGWLPPETIAKEYVRLDMVVKGRYKERYSGDPKHKLTRIPQTVAEIIGGKG